MFYKKPRFLPALLCTQNSVPRVAGEGETQMMFINTAPCTVRVTSPGNTVLSLARQQVTANSIL